jgi:hypothetical protein
LLKHKKRLRKLWQETRVPMCKKEFKQMLYRIWCLSKLYTNKCFVKPPCKCFQKKKKEERKEKGTDRD